MQFSEKTIDEYISKFKKVVEQCGDRLDMSGWRYSKESGKGEYDPIDVDATANRYSFCCTYLFLTTFFRTRSTLQNINTYDIKRAAELWAEKADVPLYVPTGIAIAACVAANLAPKELWYTMETNVMVSIKKSDWARFCELYQYKSAKSNI